MIKKTKLIKIFGARRTGTTWSRELFKENFENVIVFTNEFGSKHQNPKSLDKIKKWADKRGGGFKDYAASIEKGGTKIYPYVIIKNPYSWYQSIKRYWGKRFDMEKMYKGFNNFYSKLRKLETDPERYDNVYHEPYFMRYESLLEDTVGSLVDVAGRFSIEFKEGEIINPDIVPLSKKFTKKDKGFYLREDSFDLKSDLVKQITKLVNWRLMSFYGYEPKGV